MKTEMIAVNTATELETQTEPGTRFMVMSGKIGPHRIEISISPTQFEKLIRQFTAAKEATPSYGKLSAEVWITKETP